MRNEKRDFLLNLNSTILELENTNLILDDLNSILEDKNKDLIEVLNANELVSEKRTKVSNIFATLKKYKEALGNFKNHIDAEHIKIKPLLIKTNTDHAIYKDLYRQATGKINLHLTKINAQLCQCEEFLIENKKPEINELYNSVIKREDSSL